MLIVSYDISDDKTRTKFAKFLQQYGRRLQMSVWELKQSPRIKNLVIVEIEKVYAKKFTIEDSVFIFSICEGCMPKMVRYGYHVAEEQELVMI